MHPDRDDFLVMGMVEVSGLGWQGRHEQAEMMCFISKGCAMERWGMRPWNMRRQVGLNRRPGVWNAWNLRAWPTVASLAASISAFALAQFWPRVAFLCSSGCWRSTCSPVPVRDPL